MRNAIPDGDPGAPGSDGFDRFGRVVDQRWQNSTPTVKDQFEYGYDRASNRTWREVAPDGGNPAGFEYYTYDGLHRLQKAERGTLDGDPYDSIINHIQRQDFGLEALGNWDAVVSKTDGSDDSPYDARTHDKDNEIETIDPQGAVGSFTVVHDAAGNLKELPDRTSPTTKCERYSYDYRNRLIKIEHSDDYDEEAPTWSTVVQYEYDGLNRRVKKDLASGTDVVYLWDGWQMLEERELDGQAWEARRQFVYGGLYIDEPVAFDKDTDSDGDCTEGNGGSTRYLYAQQANFNVVALIDSAGVAVETVKYDPYGEATVTVEEGQSASGNPYLFCGYRLDDESGLYYVRNRYYHPNLGRWTSRDPSGYVEGTNLLQYVGSKPVGQQDPSGLAVTFTFHCKLVSDEIAKGDKCRRDCHYQCIETDRQLSFGGSDLPTNYPPKLVITVDTNVISWCCRITGYGTPGKCKDEFDMTRIPYGVGSDCSRAECRRACDNAYKVADALCNLDKEPITKRICKATAQALRQMCVDSCNAVCTRP